LLALDGEIGYQIALVGGLKNRTFLSSVAALMPAILMVVVAVCLVRINLDQRNK
jgi:hypothetical protein